LLARDCIIPAVTHTIDASAALRRANEFPSLSLAEFPTPIEELKRLRSELGSGARIFAKRDDAISFGFGGNKVRKLAIVAGQAIADGADALITIGGIQSNHARATAATAAKLGLRCHLVASGAPPDRLTGNALLDALLGAEVEYVAARSERVPAMRRAAERMRASGGRPAEIPLGASTPEGALGFVRAVGEMLQQGVRPDIIVHATSSGGTQAGLVAGCALHGLSTRVIGVSADDPAADVERQVRGRVARGDFLPTRILATALKGGVARLTRVKLERRAVRFGFDHHQRFHVRFRRRRRQRRRSTYRLADHHHDHPVGCERRCPRERSECGQYEPQCRQRVQSE